MTDIIKRLSDYRTIDGSVSFVEIHEETLTAAIAEIKHLRQEIDRLEGEVESIGYELKERL